MAKSNCAPAPALDTSSVLTRFAIVIVLSFLLGGAFFYSAVEGWTFTDALYFCSVTLTTVGYGDLVPTTDLSKAFTVGYIILGLSIITTCACHDRRPALLASRRIPPALAGPLASSSALLGGIRASTCGRPSSRRSTCCCGRWWAPRS